MMVIVFRKLSVTLIAFYLLCPILSFAACKDTKGLYEKRDELLKRYEREIGRDYMENKEKADMLKKQIEAIDQKYRGTIHEMFFENEKKEYSLFEKCCSGKISDGHLFFVCKLIAYYRDGNAVSLLNDMPITKNELADFWEIDGIVFSEYDYYSKPHPKLFDKASFVNLVFDSIFQLASKNNATALDKFLKIGTFADGEYGEYMEDKILSLFENYPEVIMKNWKLVKNYRSTIDFGTTDYQNKANKIIQDYQHICERQGIDILACKEIIEFLKSKKEDVK